MKPAGSCFTRSSQNATVLAASSGSYGSRSSGPANGSGAEDSAGFGSGPGGGAAAPRMHEKRSPTAARLLGVVMYELLVGDPGSCTWEVTVSEVRPGKERCGESRYARLRCRS